MSASFPCAATFWTTYELAKHFFSQYDDSLSKPVQHFLSASVAESIQALVRNPFEIIKQNQQIGIYESMTQAFTHIVKEKGFRGLYTGYGSLVM